MKKIRKIAAWLLLCTLFGTGVFGGSVYADTEICAAAEVYDEILPAEEVAEVTETEVISLTENQGSEETARLAEDAMEIAAADEAVLTGAAAVPDIETVTADMKAKFEGTGIKNTSKTNVTTYWNMLAAKSLGLSKVTETDYSAVDYKNLGIQVLAKFLIAMTNDGVNPGDYYVDNLDLVEYMCSCIGEDGGYRNRLKTKADTATASTQATVLQALAIVGAEVPQKAADFLSQYQNEDGIFSNAFGTDPDSTSWCMSACRMLGISFPNAAKAEKALSYMTASMNGNSFGCYADYLSVCGNLTAQDIRYMIEHHYSDADPSNKGFLYNGKVNASATQQCSIPLGEYAAGKSIYEILKESSVYQKNDGSSVKVTARVAEAKNASTTEDLVKRTELCVAKGSSHVLTGVTDTFDTVTLADVLTEAVGYRILGHDPSAEEISENAAAINEVLTIENTEYGYSLIALFGSTDTDPGFGYYVNRETMAWTITDPVAAGDDVFFFIYDWNTSAYAVFDAADYSGTTKEAPTVTVKKQEYDADWNPVFSPIPARVFAENDKLTMKYTCGADGKVTLSDLPAGTYDLTASYTDENGYYIVSPYATVTVKKVEEPEKEPEKKEEPSKETSSKTSKSSNSGFGSVAGLSAYGGGLSPLSGAVTTLGTQESPVSGGTWSKDENGVWLYRIQEPLRNCWAFIQNPFATEVQPKNAWFLFDAAGKMLTGWQQVGGKWYYLIPDSNGSMGACLLGTVTPDGYTVDENGAWIESIPQTAAGIVYAAAQKAAEAEAAAKAAATAATSVVTTAASTGSTPVGSDRVVYGGSAGTTSSKGKVSISLSANATTTDGKKVSFSGSKSYTLEEGDSYTAYDLLSMLCEDKGWDLDGDSNYVSGINGLSEFDCGEQSGWMYSVGGKYPNVPAGDYEVEKGKTVKWTYVTKMVATSD